MEGRAPVVLERETVRGENRRAAAWPEGGPQLGPLESGFMEQEEAGCWAGCPLGD